MAAVRSLPPLCAYVLACFVLSSMLCGGGFVAFFVCERVGGEKVDMSDERGEGEKRWRFRRGGGGLIRAH